MNAELTEFPDAHRVGVLAKFGAGGKPRQSVVYYVRDGDLLISTESERLKARDARRFEWALCVLGHERPYPSAVFSGPAEV